MHIWRPEIFCFQGAAYYTIIISYFNNKRKKSPFCPKPFLPMASQRRAVCGACEADIYPLWPVILLSRYMGRFGVVSMCRNMSQIETYFLYSTRFSGPPLSLFISVRGCFAKHSERIFLFGERRYSSTVLRRHTGRPFCESMFFIEQKEAAAPDSGRRPVPIPVSLNLVKI